MVPAARPSAEAKSTRNAAAGADPAKASLRSDKPGDAAPRIPDPSPIDAGSPRKAASVVPTAPSVPSAVIAAVPSASSPGTETSSLRVAPDVAQEAGRDDTKPRVVSAVTLEVTPGQAEKLDLARSVGTLSLVLRNQLDKQAITTAGVTKDDLLRLKNEIVPTTTVLSGPPAPQPVRYVPRAIFKEPGICVEVIRSGTRALECF